MTVVASILLPIIPLFIWSGIFLWSPMSTEGEELLQVEVSLLGRLKMLVLPFVFGVAVLLLESLWLPVIWWTFVLIGILYVTTVIVPQSYVLTTAGIRLGKGPFRRWTEFSGVRRSNSGAMLQGGPRSASYPVFLSGNREDDEFVFLLRTLVRDSYKGKTINRSEIDSLQR